MLTSVTSVFKFEAPQTNCSLDIVRQKAHIYLVTVCLLFDLILHFYGKISIFLRCWNGDFIGILSGLTMSTGDMGSVLDLIHS